MTSGRFTAILFGLVLLLGVLSALDVVTPDVSVESGLVEAEAARSGAWTCPLSGLAATDEAHLVSAAPPGDSGIAADVTFDRFLSGLTQREARVAAFPEQAIDTPVEGIVVGNLTGDLGIAARWRRQPAAIGRSWTVAGDQGPGGVLSAPCIAGTSSSWIVPGVSTAGGAEATLVLANPFASDASVRVTLALPDGPRQPVLLENIVVPAQSIRRLSLNEHAPEERDVGVVVTTRSGRVVVEALQSVNAAIGGIEGITLTSAAKAGGDSWTIPWAAGVPRAATDFEVDDLAPAFDDDEGTPDGGVGEGMARVVRTDGLAGQTSSWVWVTNVGDDDAVLLLTVHGPDGSELVDTFDEPVLPPGTIRRIDLDGLFPVGQSRAGVTIATENGVPIVASVATQVSTSDEDRTGIAVQLGAPATDAVWVVAGEAPQGRQWVLNLVNTGGEDAVVALSLWTESGIVRPEEIQAIAIPAGAQRIIDLTGVVDPTLASQVVHVRADQGAVVASRLGWSADDRLGLVAHLGVPSSVWRGGTLVPTTRFDPLLTGRLTDQGDGAGSQGS